MPISKSEGARLVRDLRKIRRARNKFLPRALFGEPGWEMLLFLYTAELEQQRVSISTLCNASKVPMTTALRWIAVLEREGLVTRNGDPLHGRRVFISLTQVGVSAMKTLVESIRRTLAAHAQLEVVQ